MAALELYENAAPVEVDDSEVDQDTVDLNALINDMVSQSEQETVPWDQMAEDASDYAFGNQLKYFEVKGGWRPIQANQIHPALQQQLGLIKQRKTQIHAAPREDADIPGAKVAEGILRWYYVIGLDVPTLICTCALDGFLTGNWILYAYWDARPDGGWNEKEKKWHGQVKVTLLPYTYFGAAPHSEKVPTEAEWVFIRRRVYVSELIHRWPEHEKRIRLGAQGESDLLSQDAGTGGPTPTGWKPSNLIAQDTSDVNTNQKELKKPDYYGRLANAIAGRTGVTDEDYLVPANKNLAMVTLLEIWFKDRRTKKVTEDTPISDDELETSGKVTVDADDNYVLAETGELLTEANRPTDRREYDEPLFPNGRHVLRIGDVVLNETEDEQRWEYKHWPFVTGPFTWVPHNWRGGNGVELLQGPQDMINETLLHVTNWVKNFGDPSVDVEEGALRGARSDEEIKQRLQSAAGKIKVFEPNRLSAIRYNTPAPMGGDVFAVVNFLVDLVQRLHGINDIAMGRSSGGKITATEGLRLESNTRLRTGVLSGDLERTTGQELMSLVWEIDSKHRTVGDTVRIVGDKNKQAVIELKGGVVDPETGVMLKGPLDAEFDIELETETTLPFDKQRHKDEAMQKMQVVGPAYMPRFLEAFDEPNPDELLQSIPIANIIQAVQELPPALAERVTQIFEQTVQDAVAAAQAQENMMGAKPGQQQGPMPEQTEQPQAAAPTLTPEQTR